MLVKELIENYKRKDKKIFVYAIAIRDIYDYKTKMYNTETRIIEIFNSTKITVETFMNCLNREVETFDFVDDTLEIKVVDNNQYVL